MLFGLICYLKQGQYSSILPSLDFDNSKLILANNIIGLITTMVAAVLYGNIGVKVFYENVLRAYCKAPPMITTKGRWYWTATVICYWAIAWVIGEAIPNITALVTLVGAACILQFTYTFPPILLLGYWMQRDAIKADRPWAPGMEPGSNRIDTWRDKSRWVRGFKSYWYVKVFLVSAPYPPPQFHVTHMMVELTCRFSSCCSWLRGPTARSASTLASRRSLSHILGLITFHSHAMHQTTLRSKSRIKPALCAGRILEGVRPLLTSQ